MINSLKLKTVPAFWENFRWLFDVVKLKRTCANRKKIHNTFWGIRTYNLIRLNICRCVHSIAVNRNLCTINKNRFTDWQKCTWHFVIGIRTSVWNTPTQSSSHELPLLLFYLFANNKRRVNYFLWLGCANNHKVSKKWDRKKHISSETGQPYRRHWDEEVCAKAKHQIKYQVNILWILLHRFRGHISQQ